MCLPIMRVSGVKFEKLGPDLQRSVHHHRDQKCNLVNLDIACNYIINKCTSYLKISWIQITALTQTPISSTTNVKNECVIIYSCSFCSQNSTTELNYHSDQHWVDLSSCNYRIVGYIIFSITKHEKELKLPIRSFTLSQKRKKDFISLYPFVFRSHITCLFALRDQKQSHNELIYSRIAHSMIVVIE